MFELVFELTLLKRNVASELDFVTGWYCKECVKLIRKCVQLWFMNIHDSVHSKKIICVKCEKSAFFLKMNILR